MVETRNLMRPGKAVLIINILAMFLLISAFGVSTARADEQESGAASGQIPAGYGGVELSAQLGNVSSDLLQGETGIPQTLTMESAVEWALEHNREIARLTLEIDAAQAGVRGSRLLYMPSLDVGGRSMSMGPAGTVEIPIPGNPIEIRTSTTDITNTISMTLSQPVYTFGSFSLAGRGASLGLDQARLNLARARQTVRNDTEEAFLRAALAQAMVGVREQAVATAEERLRIAQVRFDAGEAARFEVLRAQVGVATSRQDLLQAQTSSDLAMSALVQKMGLPTGTTIDIEPPVAEEVDAVAPGLTLDEAWQTALDNRMDLKALELAVELSEVGALSQRNRPMLAFQGNYSRSDRASMFANRESWSVVLSFTYRFYDFGRSRASMEEGWAKRDALRAQVEDIRTLVGLEVESAYKSLMTSLERIEVARATLESAREAVRIAELGYSEGVIAYIDYQDADLGYRQAETLHLQAVYEYLTAVSGLRAAMGVDDFPMQAQ